MLSFLTGLVLSLVAIYLLMIIFSGAFFMYWFCKGAEQDKEVQ